MGMETLLTKLNYPIRHFSLTRGQETSKRKAPDFQMLKGIERLQGLFCANLKIPTVSQKFVELLDNITVLITTEAELKLQEMLP